MSDNWVVQNLQHGGRTQDAGTSQIHAAQQLREKYKPFYRDYCNSLWKETDDEKD